MWVSRLRLLSVGGWRPTSPCVPLTAETRPIVEHLCQLYRHDLSEFRGTHRPSGFGGALRSEDGEVPPSHSVAVLRRRGSSRLRRRSLRTEEADPCLPRRVVADRCTGRAPVGVASVARAAATLSQPAANHPEIAEIEVNPLLATLGGAIGLDARRLVAEWRDLYASRRAGNPKSGNSRSVSRKNVSSPIQPADSSTTWSAHGS